MKTASELITDFREDERDNVAPYFWSDRQLLRWLNEAIDEYAIQSQSIVDRASPITRLELEPGVSEVGFDGRILDILEARTPERELKVVPVGKVRAADYTRLGVPCFLELHISDRLMQLYPAPAVATTLTLTVVRLPMQPVDKTSELCDIPRQHLKHLLTYMRGQAYAVQDAEVYDAQKAQLNEARFKAAMQDVYEEASRRRRSSTGRIRFNPL